MLKAYTLFAGCIPTYPCSSDMFKIRALLFPIDQQVCYILIQVINGIHIALSPPISLGLTDKG